ncbi:MAG: Rieske 2Fe-2S domain-containing protein [bacterium]
MSKKTESSEGIFSEIIKDGKTFILICSSEELKEGKGKRIAFEEDIDLQFAVFRIQNRLYCVSNICPHRHATKIFEGILKGLTVTCPLHGWTFSLLTGENKKAHQGIKKLSRYEIFEENNKVYLEKPVLNIPKWRENVRIHGGQNPVFD